MEPVTRRGFLKMTIGGISGIMLGRFINPEMGFAQLPDGMSRVVVTEHPEATDGVKVINPANVQTMMDESIKQLTNEASLAAA